MSNVLAIDPGTFESGWVWLDGGVVRDSGVLKNEEILANVITVACQLAEPPTLAIEMIASYGMPVGAEVFETCVWIGRFVQAWTLPSKPRLVFRRDVKLHLCGTSKAKDPHIRQRLLDVVGPPGTKKAPGPTYGVKSHAWAALAVAATVAGITERKAA